MRTDAEIFKDVTQKLDFDSRFDSSNVLVAVKEGIVALTGTVNNYSAKLMAENDVKAIRGVKGVAEELEVVTYGLRERSDSEIARAVRDALEWNVLVPEENIQVIVEDGVVTLMGEVSQNYQRESAFSSVRNLEGVKKVINSIRIKPIINTFEVKSKILKEFERNARIDASRVSVDVTGSKVTLKGTVRSWIEYDEAQKAAWAVPGVTNVDNQITVSYF